jgi:hypothetical protein
MSRSVFHGVGAYIGVLYSETRCKFWSDEPGKLSWDHKALIEIDLAKSPTAARAGRIKVDDIDVDDHDIYGGMTKIGPLFPDGKTIGACWITEDAWRRSTGRALDPNPDCHDYELKHVLYWSGPLAKRRFQGFHAEITSEKGTHALVTLWHAGQSKVPGARPAGTWWIDLDADAMPIEPGFTTIGVGAHPKVGALFLDLRHAHTIQMRGPKLPPFTGEELLPSLEANASHDE